MSPGYDVQLRFALELRESEIFIRLTEMLRDGDGHYQTSSVLSIPPRDQQGIYQGSTATSTASWLCNDQIRTGRRLQPYTEQQMNRLVIFIDERVDP